MLLLNSNRQMGYTFDTRSKSKAKIRTRQLPDDFFQRKFVSPLKKVKSTHLTSDDSFPPTPSFAKFDKC